MLNARERTVPTVLPPSRPSLAGAHIRRANERCVPEKGDSENAANRLESLATRQNHISRSPWGAGQSTLSPDARARLAEPYSRERATRICVTHLTS